MVILDHQLKCENQNEYDWYSHHSQSHLVLNGTALHTEHKNEKVKKKNVCDLE